LPLYADAHHSQALITLALMIFHALQKNTSFTVEYPTYCANIQAILAKWQLQSGVRKCQKKSIKENINRTNQCSVPVTFCK